jgi:hypothetical protein
LQVTTNLAGVVIIIDHEEIDTVVKGVTGGGGGLAAVLTPALTAAGVGGPIIAAVVAGVGAYVAAEAWLIINCDKGNGVYLTFPWIAIPLGQFWLIIPTTRPPDPGPVGGYRWSDRNTGTIYTEDGADVINWTIGRGAVDPQVVEFRLELDPGSTGWRKAINMPDGLGSSWDIVADGRGASASNGLWADQVHNGQVLTFRKAKFLGIMWDVLTMGDLDGLGAGDQVTFRWMKD